MSESQEGQPATAKNLRQQELIQCQRELNTVLERYDAKIGVVRIERLDAMGAPVVAYQVEVVSR